MKKSINHGVTLIALIITIIVLLILSAICLNMVLGDSGIIAKAKIAKEKTNDSQELESSNLNDLENKIGSYLTDSRSTSSKKELLYSNDAGWDSGDLALSKPWTDYSYLQIIGCFNNGRGQWQEEYLSNEIITIAKDKNEWIMFSGYDNRYLLIKIKDDKTFTEPSGNGPTCIFYVYGIK